MTEYQPALDRYSQLEYNRCGRSGLKLPPISIGLWHNFGDVDVFNQGREILRCAFDNGITHFDLANNYGPPPGSAEENFGRIYHKDFQPYRDELIISTKAGYGMWEGPYGDWGSRKYLISSLDQSLKRMGLDYVDIFYHHRPDTETPLEETMRTLDQLVRQGKALYVGISNYSATQTMEAASLLKQMGTPFIINQVRYSMFDRWIEEKLIDVVDELGIGLIAFSPLAQGLLTDKYLRGIPEGSRAANSWGFLKEDEVKQVVDKVKALNDLAGKREQSLAQMALSWILKDNRVSSVLVGVSSVKQLEDNLGALKNCLFSVDEIRMINEILVG
jgi:L-glyceraldehyde 3-phosphate reductase